MAQTSSSTSELTTLALSAPASELFAHRQGGRIGKATPAEDEETFRNAVLARDKKDIFSGVLFGAPVEALHLVYPGNPTWVRRIQCVNVVSLYRAF